MVNCIDTALEELGALDQSAAAGVANRSAAEEQHQEVDLGYGPVHPEEPSLSVPTAQDLGYDETPSAENLGYGSFATDAPEQQPQPTKSLCSQLCPNGNSRPRYRRRNSVTKFSLDKAFQQVQKEDQATEQNAHKSIPPQVWQRLYSTRIGDSRAIKRSSLDLYSRRSSPSWPLTAAAAEGPDCKRRR